MAPVPAPDCPLCGTLPAAPGFTEYSDADAPAAALLLVRTVQADDGGRSQIRRCPACGAYFLLSAPDDFSGTGDAPDGRQLRRLTIAQAATLLARP